MTESLWQSAARPRLLDLFCGAGGTGMGYARAGFEVVGVDIEPQPNYPFEFIQADVLEFLHPWQQRLDVDAIHASPPCQHFTAYKRRPGHVWASPNLIAEVRQLLKGSRLPYVIENIELARAELREPATLCGSMFALDVRRHRLFETNWPLAAPACRHDEQEAPGKRYPGATNRDGRYTAEIGVWRIPLYRQQVAMGGVHWMTREELSEAVPPAYTEHIGRELFTFLRQSAERSLCEFPSRRPS